MKSGVNTVQPLSWKEFKSSIKKIPTELFEELVKYEINQSQKDEYGNGFAHQLMLELGYANTFINKVLSCHPLDCSPNAQGLTPLDIFYVQKYNIQRNQNALKKGEKIEKLDDSQLNEIESKIQHHQLEFDFSPASPSNEWRPRL